MTVKNKREIEKARFMGKCSNCGEELEGNEKHCPGCGRKIKREKEDSDEASRASNNSPNRNLLMGAAALTIIAAALLPVFPVQESHPVEETFTEQVPREVERQEPVDYTVLSSDTGGDLSSQFNQFLGVGTTTLNIEIRNTDQVGGQFSADIQCEASSGNTISLDAGPKYIQAGEAVTLEASTDSQLDSCNQNINPPQKTVTETVMREVTRTRTVKETRTTRTNLINFLLSSN